MFMKFLRIIRANQSGMVLPLVLILLCVVAFMIIPGLQTATGSLAVNSMVQQNTMAYYAAEAGVADLLWSYQPGRTPRTSGDVLTNINGMNVKLTLKSTEPIPTGGNYFFWESSAPPDPNSKAKILVKIKKLDGTPGNNVFDYAVASYSTIEMGGSSEIFSDDDSISDGDAYANGNITTTKNKEGPTIQGDAFSAGGTISSKIDIQGAEDDNAPHMELPPIDVARYQQEANFGGPHVYDLTITNQTMNLGPKYVDHNLKIGSNAVVTLTGTVYVVNGITIERNAVVKGGQTVVCDGNITYTGDASNVLPNGTIPLFISVNGDVVVNSGANISGVLYAPAGTITLSGGATLLGSAVANSVKLLNGFKLKYLTGLREWTQLPGAGEGGGDVTLMGYDYQ